MENINFEFNTVASISVDFDGASRLGEILSIKFSERKVLIVTDKGLVNAGLVEPIKNNLIAHQFDVVIFDDVIPDPTEEAVLACYEKAKQSERNFVIGLGGGSSLDVAKVTAVLLKSEQSLEQLYGINNVKGERAKLVQIPTTSGTGSEVTNISILTTGSNTKMGIVSPVLYCDFVLLDAKLTFGLPALHTAATGIDAMVHAIEAYTSAHKKNPISDSLAREALKQLADNLVVACNDGKNRKAREAMLLGAMLAGQAFSNSPVAAVHALAYPLGGHYHISHGLSNALMLGPVLRFNMKAAAHLYAELAEVLGVANSDNDLENANNFVKKMEQLMDDSGAPRKLRDLKVTEESLVLLAQDAMKQTRLLINNPVEVTEEDALMLYKQAY